MGVDAHVACSASEAFLVSKGNVQFGFNVYVPLSQAKVHLPCSCYDFQCILLSYLDLFILAFSNFDT